MSLLIDVAAAFDEAGVDYVVVGGMAVLLHGHPRMTVDLDVVLDLSTKNVTAALEVLAEQGFEPRLPVPASMFADAVVRESWVRDRHLVAFTMHDPNDARREVDLFADSPIPFADLARAAVTMTIDDVDVRVVSLEHLLAMKRRAGRAQDHADIAALTALREDRGRRRP